MKVAHLAINVLAALLATVATTLFIIHRGERIRAEIKLEQSESSIKNLEDKLRIQEGKQADLDKKLTKSTEELGDARIKLAVAESKIGTLTMDLTQARNQLAVREQNELALNREIGALRQALEGAQRQGGDVAKYQTRIDELEQTVALLQNRAGVAAAATAVFTATRGRSISVVTIGPQNAFVVINYGSKHGAQLNQKMIIRRGTEPIATIFISDVREGFSIAQVDPASLQTPLLKGDIVLANP